MTENKMKVVETWSFETPRLCHGEGFCPSAALRTGSTKSSRTITSGTPQDDTSKENLLVLIASACNRAMLPDIGDPTEIGLLEYGKEKNVERLTVDEEMVPFTSEDKYMKTRHKSRIFLKGAPEKILSLAKSDHPSLI